MSEFIKVASLSEVTPGGMKRVSIGGLSLLLANVDGKVYATQADCTHDEGPLEDGELEDDCVRCPWHFSLFSLRTGEVIESPAADAITTYDLQVDGDDILVAVSQTKEAP